MSRVHSGSARLPARAIATPPASAGFRPAAAALAVAAVFALQPAAVRAQPAGAQVIHGQASFAQTGNNLVVTTQNGAGSNHSAINWQSFSVPAGSITQFNQPSATSTSINRVLGPDPSAIFGTLRSNGRLVLVNPAGIAVGAGAVVDTGGFTASTLQMSEADAIAGRLRFFNDGASHPLTVDGTVRAQGGDVVLIAPDVQVAGPALVQSDGATVLAAGRKVEITGRGLEGIRLEVQAGDRAVNLGTLQGDAVGIFAGTLRHSGVVQAQAVSVEGGKVVLKATGDNLVAGTVTAGAGDGKGGSIDVLGQRVGLLAGATLDASGAQGGGQVRVGGDYQGQNAAVPNAAQTYVDAAATIRADATQQGDGGRVIVWSDELTRMQGQVSARGGAQGGNGGFAEVSGKKDLAFTGRVDLRAPKGAAGTLLLDPEDVTIVHEVPSSTLGPRTENISEADGIFRRDEDGPATLTDSDLVGALNMANVLVTTSRSPGAGPGGTLTVNPDADVTWVAPTQLTLEAGRHIVVGGTIRGTDLASGLQLNAGGDIGINAGAFVSVGSLGMSAGGNVQIDAGTVEAFNGALGIDAVGLVGIASTGSGSTRLYGSSSLTIATAGSIRVGERRDSEVTPQVTLESGGLLKLRANGGHMSFGEPPEVTDNPERTGVPSSVFLSGRGVDLQAAGNLFFSGDTTVATQQQAMSVIAGGDITGNGTFYSMGRFDPAGTDGAISLDAQGGALHFRVVDSSAAGNPHAGTVTLHAQGDILGDQIAAIGSTFYAGEGTAPALAATVTTEGGSRGIGGNGAAVDVTSESGSIAVGAISTYGGSSPGGATGTVGSVTVTARGLAPTTPGLVDNQFGLELPPASIAIGAIDAAGRWGGSGANGGVVTLASDHGSIAVGAIAAGGGDSYGAGVGGNGGTVSLTAASDIIVASQPRLTVTTFGETGTLPLGSGISASGGAGGTGGAGGAGGSITLQQGTGNLQVGFGVALDAGGGQGGSAAAESTGTGGAGGNGGTVTLKALGGDLWLGGAVRTSAGLGGFDGSGTVQAPSGGAGALTLQAGGGIHVLGSFLETYRTNVTATAGGSIWLEDALATSGGLVALTAGDAQLAAGAPTPEGPVERTVNVLASIDTRATDGSPAGSVVLHAADAVRLDAAAPAQAGLVAITSTATTGGTVAGGVVDIVAPSVTVAAGTQVTGSQVRIAADDLTLDDTVTAPLTQIAALSAGRAIRLGGAEAAGTLHLSQQEINQITAGTLEVGALDAAGGITFGGAITLRDTQFQALRLLNAGAIRQAANSLLTLGNLDVHGGSVDLDQVSIGHTLVGGSLSGAFRVANRAGTVLTVGAISGASAASPVQVSTKGRLQLAGTVASAATGDAVVLSAGSFELAQGGALQAPAGRWLVYLPTPDGSQFVNASGKLDSGNFALWNRSFGQAVPETGNRYVFSVQPLLDSITVLSRTKVYDGTLLPPAVSITGTLVDASLYGDVFKQDVIGGDLLVVGQSKNVGTYAVEQGTFGVAGYGVRSFTGGTVTITPRKLNVTLSAQDKVYDGTTAASFSFGDDRVAGDALTLTGTAAFADKNAGTGKLVLGTLTGLTGADAGNYTVVTPGTATQASIARRALNLTVAAQDKVYDGSTAAVLATGDDHIAGDLLTLFVNGQFADKNAGTGKQVTVNATLAGADAGNYVVALPANVPTATISRRALNVAATAQDKVYDGSTAANVALGDDRIAGDALTLGATGSFADKNAGSGKLVNVQLADLGGSDAGNYVLAAVPSVARATITPAALTIAARDAFKFEGDALAFNGTEFTANGLVAGETIGSVTLASAGADAAAAANQYAITAGAPVGGSGFVPSNYRITFQDGLLTVLSPQASPAALQVNNQVVAFAQLFLQEALRQGTGDLPRGKDDIVLTDTACKP